MKRILCAILAALLCLLCVSCSADEDTAVETEKSTLTAQERRELKKYFKSLSEHYITSADGRSVSVTVPDFAALIDELPALRSVENATADTWRTLADKHPDLVKEYVLNVDPTVKDAVFEALWEQICIDLFSDVVGDMTLDFSDPYERGEDQK